MHFCQLYDVPEKYHTIYHKHHEYCTKVRKFKFEARGIKSNFPGDYHFIKQVSLRFNEEQRLWVRATFLEFPFDI